MPKNLDSPKRIRYALQELFAVDLEKLKKKVNKLIIQRFERLEELPTKKVDAQELEENDRKIAQQLQEAFIEENKKSKRNVGKGKITKSKEKSIKEKRKKKRGTTNNLLASKNLLLSPKLQNILGETELSRTQVVKKIWDYIKKHNLQNPEDKREILCDGLMKPVFGKKVTMFDMNKLLSKHLYNPDDVLEQKPVENTHND
ncbi:related to Protein TRI1 [Saccharomycodes ludwigii]|uniref:Related to Protein TRI1 n=1 Tax=Saccharomycodes ludwigii TaxID=36035 RepID=A0A376B4E2_9ASCO|nr:related to Protein TRI1 [Saccharomycodes ludwigii]